jgi:hypothetical protein
MKYGLMFCALLVLAPASALAQKPGDWVLGKWRNGEFWFPGVAQSRVGGQITIAYDDGTRETVSLDQVRPYTWDLGSRVECRWAGGKTWYAGEITGISKDGTQLDVKYDDGDRERIATGGCRSR